MAYKSRANISVGGPDGGAVWDCMDAAIDVPLQGTLTTAVLTPLYVVPQPSLYLTNGVTTPPDVLASGAAIARLEGGQVSNVGAATRAADATVCIGLVVFRAGVVVGGTIAFGWLATATLSSTLLGIAGVQLGATGAGTPGFTLATTVQMPPVGTNTALLPTPVSNVALASATLPLLPGDIICVVEAATASAALPLFLIASRIV